MRTKPTALVAVWAAVAVLCLAGTAPAGVITMTDGDAMVEIDPDSAAGVFNWQIGDTTHLAQQWFWFRTSLDGFTDREYSLDEISAPTVVQPLPNFVSLSYAEARFSVQITYVLIGGPLVSDLAEIIKITSHTDAPVTFSFFQYSNFDLGGDLNDLKVEIAGGNTVFQTDLGSGYFTLSETVASGSPDLCEVGVFSTTLAKLSDASIDDLDGTTVRHGPADLTWAFQWKDRTILPGHSLMISKDKVLSMEPVPEPAGLALIGIALLALRKKRS